MTLQTSQTAILTIFSANHYFMTFFKHQHSSKLNSKKNKITSSCYFSAQDIVLYSLVPFQSMNCCSDEKPGRVVVVFVCVFVGNQDGKILRSNKRFMSLVGQPSEEVVILRTSQIENIVLIYWESGKEQELLDRTEDSNKTMSPPGKSGPDVSAA